MTLLTRVVPGAVLLALSASAWALEYKFDGFASLVAGQIVSGEVAEPEYAGLTCPCFIADFNSGSLYEDGEFSLSRESRAGIQLDVHFTDTFSLVTQIVARAATEEIKPEWAYLSWDFSPGWTLQAGRKRIPLYFYSEFQDIGIAYPWVRPPQTLYGWEASNYNGANIRYRTHFGEWDINTSLYAGEEEINNSDYTRVYDTVIQGVHWKNIRGGDIEVTHDWFTGRFIYIQADISGTDRPDSDEFYTPYAQQRVMGLALNGDFGRWFVLSEYNLNFRENYYGEPADDIDAPAAMLGLGYRHQDFTLFGSVSRYWDTPRDGSEYEAERFINKSLTLRYNISASQALKVQIDEVADKSFFDFVGDTRLLSASYDLVF
jgi:hypothetical protein